MKRLSIILFTMMAVSSCLLESDADMGEKYALIASFQYPDIKFNTDSTFVNAKDTIGFGFDAMNFYHKLDDDNMTSLGGFTLSRVEMPASGHTEGLKNMYRALVPKNSAKGNIYTVFHHNPDKSKMPQHSVGFAYKDFGTCVMNACVVTNTVEVADFVKQNFKLGDRLSVKATGYLKGVKTGEAQVNLADFSAQKDSVVSTWTMFDLKKLGAVDCIDFEMISSNPDVPTYFCMDNMYAQIELQY